ncbi:MAG TPA: serine hydrolase [Firmicutes bacterium]|jgi:beta-lactamase class A|nr:serine hydrolase [Candidatus Fermentithermobacillaceae bacterium]
MGDRSVDILWSKLAGELNDACQETGVMGYSLMDLKTGRQASFRAEVLFPTASTIKIAILLGLAIRVDRGDIGWSDRVAVEDKDKVGGSGVLGHFSHKAELAVRDVAALMISLSDNTATNICIDLATMDFVNETMRSLGLENTKLRRKMMDFEAAKRGDENVSTPGELASLVAKIQERDGVTERVAEDVLSVLTLPKGGPFTLGLPEGVKRANKPGGLGNLSVDAGIIYPTPDRPFALAVCGSFLPGRPEEATAAIVRKAFGYMKVLAECTELGRS